MAIIRTYTTREALAQAAADHILDIALEAVDDHGWFAIALSGGSTPIPTYTLLANPPFSDEMPWGNTHIFWGDERSVPPDDKDSNYKMVHDILLDPLSIPEANIHRIQGEMTPQLAAKEYEKEIRHFFPGDPPHFDLILLGMGEDGHIASLFPDSTAFLAPEKSRLVLPNYIDTLDSWRITFTPRLINAAYHVTFLVSGEEKAERVYQVLSGRYHPESLPAQIVKPVDGTVTWYLDESASKYLHAN
ncbi:MAG: 6-phosphogluconolactonase [Anaerolineales bacterium]